MLSLEELEQMQTDRLINSIFSLWNSLITLNGLIIGAISILFSLNSNIDKTVVLIIYLMGFLPIILLIWNYFVIRGFYSSIEKIDKKQINNLTDKEYEVEKQKGINEAINKRKRIKIREVLSIVFTFANIIFVFIIITQSKGYS